MTATAQISAEEVLKKSIEYHDPHGAYSHHNLVLHLNEKRPNGSDRKSRVRFNLKKEEYQNIRITEGVEIKSTLIKGITTITIDGKTNYSEEQKEKYRINPERVAVMKDYYQYLWLLPMKLNDPGTNIDPEVKNKDFFGKSSLELKVTYDPEVGKDVWYFYFNPNTYALQGYRFYHVEADNDGEYILLEGETKFGKVKLSKSRKWYTHKEDKFLGEDVLDKLEIK